MREAFPHLVAGEHVLDEEALPLGEALVDGRVLGPAAQQPGWFWSLNATKLVSFLPVDVHVVHVTEVQVVSRQRIISQISEILRSQVLSSITRHGVFTWRTQM